MTCGKDFISPISDSWKPLQFMNLLMSMILKVREYYKIEFGPKRFNHDLALVGVMWITKIATPCIA